MELNFNNNKIYNNLHEVLKVSNPTQHVNTVATPVVPGKKETTLVKSISDLSIDTQLRFQYNESSELLLNELKSFTKTNTDKSEMVSFYFEYNYTPF